MTSSPARLPVTILALLTAAGTGVAAPSVAACAGPGLTQRPAIGPNGRDRRARHGTGGHRADGTVRFRQSIGVAKPTSNVCIDDAGRIYTTFAGCALISARRGSLDCRGGSSFTTHAGPNVGPDGNTYLIEGRRSGDGLGFDPSRNVGVQQRDLPEPHGVAFDHDSVFAASDFIPVDCDCLTSGA